MIQIKRAYDPALEQDGRRILVDRLWPRGLTKERLSIERWAKELSPSTELRNQFCHDPAKWDEFQRRYKEELVAHKDLLQELADASKQGNVTLIYAAKDQQHNEAVVLKEVIEELAR